MFNWLKALGSQNKGNINCISVQMMVAFCFPHLEFKVLFLQSWGTFCFHCQTDWTCLEWMLQVTLKMEALLFYETSKQFCATDVKFTKNAQYLGKRKTRWSVWILVIYSSVYRISRQIISYIFTCIFYRKQTKRVGKG
jgi:hypothetical protein